MQRTGLDVEAPVHSSAVFAYKEGAHRHPPRDVKRLTHGHREVEGRLRAEGRHLAPCPVFFHRTRGPAVLCAEETPRQL